MTTVELRLMLCLPPDQGVRPALLRDGRGVNLHPPPLQANLGIMLRRVRTGVVIMKIFAAVFY